MSTLLSWVPLALYFMGSLAATSLVGLGCYKAGRWMEAKLPKTLRGLEFVFVCIVIFGIISSASERRIVAATIEVVAVICGAGTYAEQAVLPSKQSWADIFLRTLFTTGCCVALSFSPIFVAVFNLPRSLVPTPEVAIAGGSALGAFCSPSVIPAFTWIWRSLEMRPGVDKHLESEDGLKTE